MSHRHNFLVFVIFFFFFFFFEKLQVKFCYFLCLYFGKERGANPSGHLMPKWRRIDVDATHRR